MHDFVVEAMEKVGITKYPAELQKIPEVYLHCGGAFWIVVDREQEEVIGSIGLQKINKNTGMLRRYYVREDYRGKKIGFHLYQLLEQFAIQHQFTMLFLSTKKDLHCAHAIYEKNGWIRQEKDKLPKGIELEWEEDHYLYIKYMKEDS